MEAAAYRNDARSVNELLLAADEGEAEREQIRHAGVEIEAGEVGDGRAQGGDLRQREIHEDDAALDHVNTEVGVDAGEDQAGHEGR